ncbi:MAG: hypothetical protein ACKO9Q_24695, partial [Pirellula sp.]
MKKSSDLDIANTKLQQQQRITKSSRDALSTVLDEVVGSIFDDQMSQIPDFEQSRINMLQSAIGQMQKFVDKHPDDWDLKLDVLRLLTRLGNLQSEAAPESAIETFNRASEMIAQAKNVPDSKIIRVNWIASAIDSEYYRGEFLVDTKNDYPAALQSNEVCFELAQELVKHESGNNDNQGLISRLHRQKSTILERQDRLDDSLSEADMAVKTMFSYFGEGFLKEDLSDKRIKEIYYGDILVFISALDQRSSVLKNLSRRQ